MIFEGVSHLAIINTTTITNQLLLATTHILLTYGAKNKNKPKKTKTLSAEIHSLPPSVVLAENTILFCPTHVHVLIFGL